jgi:hypothetical protein
MPLVRDSQVKLSQSLNQCKGSPIDSPVSPLSVQPILASLPADIQALLTKFPSILRSGGVVLNPSHGVEHHIQTGGHPPVFAYCLDSDKLEIAKA